jgi:hypothetical protein
VAGTSANAMPGRTLAAALTAIVLLAFPLPYGAVKMVHARRVRAADAQIAALAAELQRTRPALGHFLMGPGDRPRAIDDRWNVAVPAPLDRLRAVQRLTPTPDPWGNGYIVLTSATTNVWWVLSAGPDGILQTPCDPAVTSPHGDDRGTRVPSR